MCAASTWRCTDRSDAHDGGNGGGGCSADDSRPQRKLKARQAQAHNDRPTRVGPLLLESRQFYSSPQSWSFCCCLFKIKPQLAAHKAAIRLFLLTRLKRERWACQVHFMSPTVLHTQDQLFSFVLKASGNKTISVVTTAELMFVIDIKFMSAPTGKLVLGIFNFAFLATTVRKVKGFWKILIVTHIALSHLLRCKLFKYLHRLSLCFDTLHLINLNRL